MKYKKSKYNVFVPYENDETIIFNTYTGAMGKFDKDTLDRYNKNKLTSEEINTLVKKGVFIEKNKKEIDNINADRLAGIKNDKKKLYRIWTTSACNARCYYCFEKGVTCEKMSNSTADEVVNFISSKINNENEEIELEWFGGEPLLNIDVIDYIIKKLKPICLNKNCTLKSSMISNGSLINEQLAKKMKNEWGLYYIQVTLDGYDNVYNQAKNYYDSKKYNFWTVIDAIKYLAKNEISVAIRMNYDTKNYNSLAELIEFLHKEFASYKTVSYYVYPVWSSTDEKAKDSFNSNTYADTNLLNLFELLVKYKMSTTLRIARLNYKKNACQGWSENTCAILPNGNICKCSESFNQILGNVKQGIINKKLFKFWTNAKVDKKCQKCVWLPLCQGGCKSSHFNRMPQCFAFKPIIEKLIRWHVKHLENDIATATNVS